MSSPSASLVIASVAKPPYAESLRITQALIRHHWPDNPWPPIALVAEPGESWGAALCRGLRRVASDYVLVWMDDYWVTEPPDTEKLHEALLFAYHREAPYCRVVPTPGPDEGAWRLCGVGPHAFNAPYRFSLQAAWVRKDYLMRCAIGFEDPWSFELRQPGLATEEHLSVHRDVRPLSYCEGLKRGKWTEAGQAACEAAGIPWPGAGA